MRPHFLQVGDVTILSALALIRIRTRLFARDAAELTACQAHGDEVPGSGFDPHYPLAVDVGPDAAVLSSLEPVGGQSLEFGGFFRVDYAALLFLRRLLGAGWVWVGRGAGTETRVGAGDRRGSRRRLRRLRRRLIMVDKRVVAGVAAEQVEQLFIIAR